MKPFERDNYCLHTNQPKAVFPHCAQKRKEKEGGTAPSDFSCLPCPIITCAMRTFADLSQSIDKSTSLCRGRVGSCFPAESCWFCRVSPLMPQRRGPSHTLITEGSTYEKRGAAAAPTLLRLVTTKSHSPECHQPKEPYTAERRSSDPHLTATQQQQYDI